MISRDTLYDRAAHAAERVIRQHNITSLPVDPIAIADSIGIEVVAKQASDGGVSGMLIRYGEQFCIAYATHIKSQGFRRFTIAHELGHYFLEGHFDAIFKEGSVHESKAGFVSSAPYELEADHFAARLLMPNALFFAAQRHAGEGLVAVESLADTCLTSLSSTAIRYAECAREPVAIIVSTGNIVDFCVMSKTLRECDGIDWIRKKQALPLGCATRSFNSDPERIRRAERLENESTFQEWFGGDLRITVTEDVLGLGSYGKTLTVLHGIELAEDDDDSDEDEEKISESWTPRFRRK
jgi:Zn-dependent peptidase ImmA (M78 family)